MKRISFIFISLFSNFIITSCGKDAPKGTTPQNTAIAVLSVSHSPKFDFGLSPVDTVKEQTFTVTNLGAVIATQMTGSFYLSQSFDYKGGNYPGEGGTCGTLLNPHADCSLVVVFTPKYIGPVQTTLVINYNNGALDTTVTGPTLAGQGN